MQESSEKGKKDLGTIIAKAIAACVYVGVVVVVTIMFISFVLTAFDDEQYFTLAIMTFGGILVGSSSIAFPIALHEWATEGAHRWAGVILYVIEILFISMNTMVSFTVLRASQSSEFFVPLWMTEYEPYSVLSIVYVLAAWGIMFMLDPDHKVKRDDKKLEREKNQAQHKLDQQRAKNKIKQEQLIADKETEFLDSVEGEDFIMQEATQNIAEEMQERSNSRGRRHFGSGKLQATQANAFDVDQVKSKGDSPNA